MVGKPAKNIVGFIALGDISMPMVANLLKNHLEVVVFDLRDAKK